MKEEHVYFHCAKTRLEQVRIGRFSSECEAQKSPRIFHREPILFAMPYGTEDFYAISMANTQKNSESYTKEIIHSTPTCRKLMTLKEKEMKKNFLSSNSLIAGPRRSDLERKYVTFDSRPNLIRFVCELWFCKLFSWGQFH